MSIGFSKVFEFQSTSPVWGMTGYTVLISGNPGEFQSTSPVWGMTRPQSRDFACFVISIHIPRVGDDTDGTTSYTGIVPFQSTSPVWGMTRGVFALELIKRVSIHIPRVGDDSPSVAQACHTRLPFQSTSPVWGMTQHNVRVVIVEAPFQSTSPVWGMT